MGGFFLIDKPENITSAQALNQIKKRLKIKKLGHAGTLDPFATGLLILASYQATKLLSLFQNLKKTYQGVFTFGKETNTADKTGEALHIFDKIPTLQEIEKVLPSFVGKIWQTPPIFSALHVEGKRAYDLARQGKEVILKPREVHIHSFEIIDYKPPKLFVKVVCSEGTYIRSLATDLGKTLGTGAFVEELRRTHIGDFCVQKAFLPQECMLSHQISYEEGLFFIPDLKVKQESIQKILHGIPFSENFLLNLNPSFKDSIIYRLVSIDNKVIALMKEGRYFWVRNNLTLSDKKE